MDNNTKLHLKRGGRFGSIRDKMLRYGSVDLPPFTPTPGKSLLIDDAAFSCGIIGDYDYAFEGEGYGWLTFRHTAVTERNSQSLYSRLRPFPLRDI